MHAYLLIGQTAANLQEATENLAKKLHLKIMEFPLVKIDDVRSLNNLIRLSFDEPTLIVSQNIQDAGEEALNAFLKNLEEPQENVFFALTAPSTQKVLPTIVSRCEVIRTMVTLRDNNSQLTINNEEAGGFVKMTTGEKLAYIDKIRDRGKAIEFAENTANFLHSELHKNELKYSVQARILEGITETLSRLKANGNVNLQLSNFVIKYAK